MEAGILTIGMIMEGENTGDWKDRNKNDDDVNDRGGNDKLKCCRDNREKNDNFCGLRLMVEECMKERMIK